MQLRLPLCISAIALSFALFGCQSPSSPGDGNSTDKAASESNQSQSGATLADFVGTWAREGSLKGYSGSTTLTITSTGLDVSSVGSFHSDATSNFSATPIETLGSDKFSIDLIVEYTASEVIGVSATDFHPDVGHFDRLTLSLDGDSLTLSSSFGNFSSIVDAREAVVDACDPLPRS